MMGDAIQKRRGHPGIADCGGPVAKGEVGGEDDTGLHIEFADWVEYQLSARSDEPQIARFIEHDEIETR